jgi:bacillithiol biosynthesis deacetylase BshB1
MDKVYMLAFGSHPDDVELSCSGTIIKHTSAGDRAAVIDLTRGELGTRGTVQTRNEEAQNASRIMNLTARENLDLPDGFFTSSEQNLLAVIGKIRKYKPSIVLCNAMHDRHPDHAKGSSLVSDACFLSGLIKIKTREENQEQEPWRPTAVYHYIQDRYIQPSFLVDITGFIEQKMECIRAYKTQFHNPGSSEPQTYISSPLFLNSIHDRAAEFGRIIGVGYAEGFVSERLFGVNSLKSLI